MKKRIIIAITASMIAAACFAGCTDKTVTESSQTEAPETAVTTVEETAAAETVEASETAATEQSQADGIPQPGDTYNGHTVDHTEDQPNCDDGSHGTIWVFYTDSDDVDFIEY